MILVSEHPHIYKIKNPIVIYPGKPIDKKVPYSLKKCTIMQKYHFCYEMFLEFKEQFVNFQK